MVAGTDGQGNKRTRIKVEEFGVAIRLGEAEGAGNGDEGMALGRYLEGDEVECLLANIIYKVCFLENWRQLLLKTHCRTL